MAANPELRPLGQALGTEALGIDLSKPLDDATFAWIEEPSPIIRCWCSATRISAPGRWRRSAAGSAGRGCIRWSIIATRIIPRSRG